MSAHPSHRPLVATVLVVAVVIGGLLAACGVPLDSEPRAITRATVAPEDVPPTTSASPAAQQVSAYFLRGEQLVEERPRVTGEPTLSTALMFAVGTPATPSLRTAVPPGTELRSAEVRKGTARIDLSGEINDISGETQKQAFAQLVFTALSVPGVERVRFRVDGQGVDAPTDDGNKTLVTADDYDPPLNPR